MNQKPLGPAASASNETGVIAWLSNLFLRYPSWIGAGFTALCLAAIAMSPHKGDPNDFAYRQFGRLPVIADGRCKPMDTVARMNLMVLTHRQQFYNPDTGVTIPATKWYLDSATLPLTHIEQLDVLFRMNSGEALDYKIFRIENDQVLKLLGLPMRDGLRYTLRELIPGWENVLRVVAPLLGDENHDPADPKNYTLVQAKCMELKEHVGLFLKMANHSAPLVIPNADGSDQWKSFAGYMEEAGGNVRQDIESRTFATYAKLFTLYGKKGQEKEFNKVLADHLAELDKSQPDRMRVIDREIFFNEFAPFYVCLGAYVLIALVAAGSWLAMFAGSDRWGSALRRSAFAAMFVVFLLHCFALLMRMYLLGRPPIINLYSSAVFIGWGSVLLCLILESLFRYGIATVVGSVLGFATLIIAHLLSLDGDTMTMMQAVLDTNFWLATHVTCVSFGYVTVAVAGFMGIAYILLGVFTNALRGGVSAVVTSMIYGVLCTGMFFSFVGTVLGGLWADYSWGRFWGWDPKENGALLIVIWVALILHARWGGMVKQRGIAVLSVLGIIVTGWSWFGTNFLGVGLHSYGFMGGAMMALVLIDFLVLAIAGLGMMPLEHWQSFRPPSKMAPHSPLPPLSPTGIKV